MATKVIGGGSSAVAASSHAACARFRGTDPLITGVTRRGLAKAVGFQDDFGGIPEARWMRAMTFERLVRDEKFASEVATTAVGRLNLARPTKVVTVNARINVDRTAKLLADAHDRAVAEGAATMIHGLAVPFVGFEDERATDVKPDFAVVAPQVPHGDDTVSKSWLILGDAKDYERVRSRIDDARLLKGFLQVALGAESAANWSQLPADMAVHSHGVLAVPRNAFLQPEALVENLGDHREEVRTRVGERRREATSVQYDAKTLITDHVRHLEATFNPATCSSCTLFSFCRHELRSSEDPTDLLVEIGISRTERPLLVGMVDGSGLVGDAAASTRALVAATLDGVARPTGQARIDQAGLPGTVNVVIAKSDSAALGVYGIAVQRVSRDGPGKWQTTVFDDPQSADTRRAIMKVLGKELTAAMKDRRQVDPEAPDPVHVVVPDKPTADVLVSIADNLAGIELSRLRWVRDKQMGRRPLTFNGEDAEIPAALRETERTAVSFLLEEDRARALALRSPIVDARAALARHIVAGGPAVNALRLDYLVPWAEATAAEPLDHRALADLIEAEEHTPGARLTNRRSNAIHQAFTGRGKGDPRPADIAKYHALIRDELAYKSGFMDRAVAALACIVDSRLREVYRSIEGDAQAIWRRRLSLHASDLVRFGRTYRHWRNSLVPAIEADDRCAKQLLALTNPQAALDAARNAGTREIATARVVTTAPLTIEIDSRRIGAERRVVLLHVNEQACVESDGVVVAFLKGSFKITGLGIGPLAVVDAARRHFEWSPAIDLGLTVGDELIVANFEWFSSLKGNQQLNVARPTPDTISAPAPDCTEDTYADDPTGHRYCCRPHEIAEAEWSDSIAERRARGELNPQAWPPLVDGDAFEVSPTDARLGDPTAQPATPVPDDVTVDDLE
ncbi:MAG: hypothetical protein ACTHK1_05240 [Actinomycetales bacterium]